MKATMPIPYLFPLLSPIWETWSHRDERSLSLQTCSSSEEELTEAMAVPGEIAEARDIPMGVDCVSPASHSAFDTPLEMMHFIAKLRELSGGKPGPVTLGLRKTYIEESLKRAL